MFPPSKIDFALIRFETKIVWWPNFDYKNFAGRFRHFPAKFTDKSVEKIETTLSLKVRKLLHHFPIPNQACAIVQLHQSPLRILAPRSDLNLIAIVYVCQTFPFNMGYIIWGYVKTKEDIVQIVKTVFYCYLFTRTCWTVLHPQFWKSVQHVFHYHHKKILILILVLHFDHCSQ